MRLFGLIGFPLTHSFSKKYFTEKFEREGLTNCRYQLFPIRTLHELRQILKEHPSIEGLNVTIPYKQQVMEYLDSRTGIPPGLNACNCIRVKNEKLEGFNTDHTAFKNSLQPLLRPWHDRALILGNGGAAAAVAFALKELKIGYAVVSRIHHDGSTLTYDQLNEKIISENTLIINTTPVGMHPDNSSSPAIPYRYISEKHLLYDLIYNPAKTEFLKRGEEKGATIKNGEEMLVLQAEESWRIWNQ